MLSASVELAIASAALSARFPDGHNRARSGQPYAGTSHYCHPGYDGRGNPLFRPIHCSRSTIDVTLFALKFKRLRGSQTG